MTKKSFSGANPALAFISTANQNDEFQLTQPTKEELEKQLEVQPLEQSVPMKRNPEFIETKSKRVQMLMQPSLYDAVKAKAKLKGISVNEMMHEVLKAYVENN